MCGKGFSSRGICLQGGGGGGAFKDTNTTGQFNFVDWF